MPSELESMIHRRVRAVGQEAVAAAIGKDQSTVSKMLRGELGCQLSCAEEFLKVLGLRVISCDDAGLTTIPKSEYDALKTLAESYFMRK